MTTPRPVQPPTDHTHNVILRSSESHSHTSLLPHTSPPPGHLLRSGRHTPRQVLSIEHSHSTFACCYVRLVTVMPTAFLPADLHSRSRSCSSLRFEGCSAVIKTQCRWSADNAHVKRRANAISSHASCILFRLRVHAERCAAVAAQLSRRPNLPSSGPRLAAQRRSRPDRAFRLPSFRHLFPRLFPCTCCSDAPPASSRPTPTGCRAPQLLPALRCSVDRISACCNTGFKRGNSHASMYRKI
jgi:hypothetical protein